MLGQIKVCTSFLSKGCVPAIGADPLAHAASVFECPTESDKLPSVPGALSVSGACSALSIVA